MCVRMKRVLVFSVYFFFDRFVDLNLKNYVFLFVGVVVVFKKFMIVYENEIEIEEKCFKICKNDLWD